MNDCLRVRVLTSNVWTADDEIGCTAVEELGCERLDSIPGRVDRECIDIVQMSCMSFKLQGLEERYQLTVGRIKAFRGRSSWTCIELARRGEHRS